MTAEFTPQTISIDEFIASKQLKFFQDLKQQHFSGRIVFENSQTQWILILYLGRILYALGGNHPVRRWRRNLAYYFPQMAFRLQAELSLMETQMSDKVSTSWDYHLLYLWVEQEKIDLEQAIKMIRAIVTEVFFDITQAGDLTYTLHPQAEPWQPRLTMIDAEQQIIDAWKLCQEWEELKIARFSPNLAPRVKEAEKLRAKTPEKTYQALIRLLDGKDSLRDLSIRKQTGLLLAARSIIPYIQLDFIELVEIPDLPVPIAVSTQQKFEVISNLSDRTIEDRASQLQSTLPTRPLIACIESNSLVCQIVKKIVTSAGYNFISHHEPLTAIALLLDTRPNLILINLELAHSSGYELCSQLRQLPYFQNIPIVLFSKNINLVDRVKAKMVGCSELFDRPLETKSILSIITKYCGT
jgi:two-component system, chemotaxis family, response regulator PixG